jgi:hypothetical protein
MRIRSLEFRPHARASLERLHGQLVRIEDRISSWT